jgi:hypothetical protein
MRLLSLASAGGIAALGALGFTVAPAAAAPAPAYSCTGTLADPGFVPAGAYASLALPAGSACVVVGDVSVTKPVSVGEGAALVVFAGSLSIGGPVSIAEQGVLASFDNATPVHIRGPVTVGQDGAFMVGTESPFSPHVNSVGGVTGNGASSVQIHNADISGPVRIDGGGGHNTIVDLLSGGFPGNFNDLEDDTISGGVSVVGYGGVWMGVIRDTIRGPFTFAGNTQAVPDEYDIGSDTIYGPATCSGNSPAPNLGGSPGGPSTVFGPVRGDQAATCVSGA